MNQKLLIFLFCTVLYNGVTYSSETKQFADTKLLKEKLPEDSVVSEAIKKNVGPTLIPTSIGHLVSNVQNETQTMQHSDVSTTQKTTVIYNSKNESTEAKSATNVIKNENQDSMNKVVSNKISNQTLNNNTIVSPDNVHASENSSLSTSTNITSNSTILASTTAAPVKTTIKSTVSIVPPTPTLTTKVVTLENTPAPAEEKHFDGPSFIGGIVLTIGLTAIGFIAFKYYKSGKIDMNYRTL